jgi:hypothetical protein
MSKIPTAEEFLKEKGLPMTAKHSSETGTYYIMDALKDFAQLHVEAALEAAAVNVKRLPPDEEYCHNCYGTSGVIDVNSILNAYPLTNIK